MSKVRDLKKDVKQMGKFFINECYTQLAFTPSLNQEYILDIIADAIDFQKNTIKQIATRNGILSYNEIASRYYEGIIEFTDRLNSLEY